MGFHYCSYSETTFYEIRVMNASQRMFGCCDLMPIFLAKHNEPMRTKQLSRHLRTKCRFCTVRISRIGFVGNKLTGSQVFEQQEAARNSHNYRMSRDSMLDSEDLSG